MSRRLAVFYLVVSSLVVVTGLQFWRLWPAAPSIAVWGLTVLLFWAMLAPQFLYRWRPGVLEAPYFPWLAGAASALMGVWATFILFSLALDVACWAAGLALGRPVLLPWALRGVAWASLAISALGLRSALSGPIVREVDLPIAGLPAALEGLKIVHLSDLHIGPLLRTAYVERVVARVRALAPDLVALTGDLIDGTTDAVGRYLEPLKGLKAPLGAYYVTGNHEYYWDAEAWIARARALGLIALVDENRVVDRGGAKILVGGVADSSAPQFVPAHKSDPRAAAASDAKADFKMLLAHRPDACLEAEPAGFDLQLSGHTHGGQFFPFSLLIRAFHRYHRGLNRHGRMWVYVNPGTGFWGPPHRFWVPAEITLLRLKAA